MDFELGDSLVLLSVEDSLVGDFSVLASVFFVLLFVESALLFFSLVLFEDGLVALSAAGLFAVVDDLIEGDGESAGIGVGEGFALTDGVMVAAADAAGVMVAPTLAVAAGVALAFVEAVTPVVVPAVVPVVVVPVVVPDVEVTPTLKLGVTP